MSYNLGDELRSIREINEYTQDEVAAKFNVSKRTICRWESNSGIKSKYLEAYERCFNLPNGYLTNGLWKEKIATAPLTYDEISIDNALSPEAISNKLMLDADKKYCVINHKNDLSTYPFILENDTVYIEITSVVSSGDIAVVKYNDETMVRKITYVDYNRYTLEPLSPMYPPITVDNTSDEADDYHILGIIRAVIREYSND